MLKKLEHNYTNKVKASARKARGIDEKLNKSSPTRKSAITEIMLRNEQRATIQMAGMNLISGGPGLLPHTAGKDLNLTTSTDMVRHGGNVYKYKEDVTAGNVSRMSGPEEGKKFPPETMWYNNRLVNFS